MISVPGRGKSLPRPGRRLLRGGHRSWFGLLPTKASPMRPAGDAGLHCPGGSGQKAMTRRSSQKRSLMPRCGIVILMVKRCLHVMYGLLERSCMRWCIHASLHSTQIAMEVRLALVGSRASRTAEFASVADCLRGYSVQPTS